MSALLGLVLLAGSRLSADDPKGNAEAEAAIQKQAEEFVAAFNKGDAKALAEFWTEEGDYIDAVGRQRKGRKAITEAYEKLFAAKKGAKLNITVLARRFVKPDFAIEDGLTEVFPADGGPPSTARDTLVHVKQDGRWLVDTVREAVAAPPSNHEHLEVLEWLVGNWAEESEHPEAGKVSYAWAHNQNFLLVSYATTRKDIPVSGGVQWIGWDPAGKRIRSWSFDTSGAFSEGVWARDGQKWAVRSVATLRDGQKVSATNIITKVDRDHFTWQSVKRSRGEKELPDTPILKLKRVK